MGRKGEGPGELSFPSPLAAPPGDTVAVCDYRNGRVTRFTPGGQLQVERPGQQLDTREKQTFELDSAVLVLSGIDEARSPGGTRPWGVVRDSLDVPFVVRFAVHQDGA